MTMSNYNFLAFLLSILVLLGSLSLAEKPKVSDRHQYAFEEIAISGASASEPIRDQFSMQAALTYIEQGAKAWTEKRQCVSCHTNGSYLLTRPALSNLVGPPDHGVRRFFVNELEKLKREDRENLKQGLKPTEIAYLAGGLAEWDRHVTGILSEDTEAALELMFDVQAADGSYRNEDCWPPLESSDFHGATVAAMAAVAAPNWLDKNNARDSGLAKRFKRLKGYLRNTNPPHDYARLLLLWASARIPDLIDLNRKNAIVSSIWKHQQDDGGWSLRTFAKPEAWGSGNRARKLLAEPELNNPQSDGHMTGLAVLVLRESGVDASDARIEQAVQWLKSNQRQSGRWWTRSLNTDRYHFITYSGTCYPLLALAQCNALE
jgi:squalene-hopene/tetraprenyl-beta-curcumene cyclase